MPPVPFPFPIRRTLASALLGLSAVGLGCMGDLSAAVEGEMLPGARRPGGGNGPGGDTGSPATPVACDAPPPVQVSRLPDRHLVRAIADLLSLQSPPDFRTNSSELEDFIQNRAASVSGAVATKLRDLVERLAGEATAAGKPAVQCAGDNLACARAFIDDFAGRAFRRPLSDEERAGLEAVYVTGRDLEQSHAAGIRLVIEAVLQAPSFLYLDESAPASGEGHVQLDAHQIAAKLGFFLLDGLPDAELRQAAASGALLTREGLEAEVTRLLQRPEVQANVSKMLMRLFQQHRLSGLAKAPEIGFTPALATAMENETARFIDDVLWKRGAKLEELLTSRRAFVDATIAPLYGLPAPASGVAEVLLPESQRSGLLTRAGLMTLEARPEDSSVVHRGVFIVRELLCFDPPPPEPTDLAAGELINKEEPTERARSEKRMAIARCAGCHGYFDPLGLPFEHYDTLGRYRTEVGPAGAKVPVDASATLSIHDIQGQVKDALDLSSRLAQSDAVKACIARQFASYALGRKIPVTESCGTQPLAERFTQSGGDLVELIRAVATWPGLAQRRPEPEVAP